MKRDRGGRKLELVAENVYVLIRKVNTARQRSSIGVVTRGSKYQSGSTLAYGCTNDLRERVALQARLEHRALNCPENS